MQIIIINIRYSLINNTVVNFSTRNGKILTAVMLFQQTFVAICTGCLLAIVLLLNSCLITWKTIHTAQPPYLSELITHYLRPEPCVLPTQIFWPDLLHGITTNFFLSRAFSASAPSTWNSLPARIHSLDKLSTFKRQLKSHIFQSAVAVLSPCASASDSFCDFGAV